MSMAYSLRNLIEQSIDPDSWYDNYPETAEGTRSRCIPQESPKKMAVSHDAGSTPARLRSFC